MSQIITKVQNVRPSFIVLSLILAIFTFMGATCGGGGAGGGVLRSNDVGETWEFKNYIGQIKNRVYTLDGVNVHKMRIDTKNVDTMYLLTLENGIYKTDSAGDQWYQLPINTGVVRDLQINPVDSQVLFAAYGSQIIRSIDAGGTWESLYTDVQGAAITRLAIDWFNPARMYAGTSLGTVLESEDAGLNWRVVYDIDGQVSDLLISQKDSRILYITEIDRSIHRTRDGGRTWVDLLKGPERAEDKPFQDFLQKHGQATTVKGIFLDAQNDTVLYATTAQGLMKSTDEGTNWEMVKTLVAEEAPENALMKNVLTFNDKPGVIIFTINNQIHKSIDGGATWKTVDNYPSTQVISALVRLPKRPEKILTVEERAAQIAANQNANINTNGENPNSIVIDEDDVLFSGVQAPPKKKSSFFPTPE